MTSEGRMTSQDFSPLPQERLLANGFNRAGRWTLTSKGSLKLEGDAAATPGVYAFAVSGTVQYVGSAARDLKKRLYFYANPGSGQRTNLRLNLEIRAVLDAGGSVDICTARPPNFEWQGFRVSGVHGLEEGIISAFYLPWNVRGAVPFMQSAIAAISAEMATSNKPVPSGSADSSAGKYGPLRAHLAACDKEIITLTFGQIEKLVGPLPKSASLYQAWWANHENNVQAKSWMAAKYIAQPNCSGRSVVFRRFSY